MMARNITAPSFSEQNKDLLRRRFPGAQEMLDGLSGNIPSAIKINMSRAGIPTVAVEMSSGAIHVASTFNPVVEADRWASEMCIRDWDIGIVVGMGVGYHLERLLELVPARRLLVIEPDPNVFSAALAAKDQSKILGHPALDLIVTDDARAAADSILRTYGKDMLHRAVEVFVWPPTSRYSKGFVSGLETALADGFRAARVNLTTTRAFALQWVGNFFHNAEASVRDPGIVTLHDQFRGRPAIIVAAGPSLEKNVHELHKAKGKAVIIAAGSTINALLKYGIEPDLLVSFDPGKSNYRHFKNLENKDIPLVYIPTIYPRIVKEYGGPRFVAGLDTLPFVSWFFEQVTGDKGHLTSGPSVANIAWELAYQLDLNPIILVGQDLAYTDMKSHVDGVVHARDLRKAALDDKSRYIATEGIDEQDVVTDVAMNSMKFWFEQRLSQLPSGHVTFDATEGGAKIAGTLVTSLAKVLKEHCTEAFHPGEAILDIYQRERSRLADIDFGSRLSMVYTRMQKGLNEASNLSNRGIAIGNALLRDCQRRRLTSQSYMEALHRLQHSMKCLVGLPAHRTFTAPLTEHVVNRINLTIQTRLDMETDLQAKGTHLAKEFITLFAAIRDTSTHVRRLVERRVNGA